ncbi:MAG: bifunctional methylenetetrahydrofolate dehydrogenase/methenyltetrahydrofolate cyclohydrolase FolD [Nitrospinota bacterium]|nr:bifunctional methylenetetrahydrofolate dehydrogenase/methenyltetrahydrofolate cyclohydrolase FolD [Nitrospinota bacterium]MDH5678187.1 bifunctional methylenetetrahydrofolate dehydrogenase/methenyltetrahydrofolate cyclohydrolase FolD [Nitrospinota bacterium]
MTTIIDGKTLAASIRAEINEETSGILKERGEKPGLAVVLAGDDPASAVYVRLKEKACAEVGMASFQHNLPSTVTQEELLALIDKLNHDKSVNGILIQLPLYSHLDSNAALDRVDPAKDVDGFHPVNVGLLSQNLATLMPCTPAGCMEMLDRYNIPIEGAHAVVVGRSNIVGKPLAAMMLHRNATVTICHSRTRDLKSITRQADILVAAIGRPKMITADMVKPGATVLDVGISKVENKLFGDVDFEQVKDVAGFITPVPGGVGPMTIAMLLSNTILAYKMQRGLIVSMQDDRGRKIKG